MEYTETNRDKNKEAEKKRMIKHSANLASIYRTTILKRVNKTKEG